MNLKQQITRIAKRAKEASGYMAQLSSPKKDAILKEMALSLLKNKEFILRANKKDIAQARRRGIALAFLERLTLSEKRIKEMAECLIQISRLKDPVGGVIKAWATPNGLRIRKVRVPVGVIAIIYESRPNVTSDCIGLAFKSGNSVILRGGSEALTSNLAIFKLLKAVLINNRIPEGAVSLLATADRSALDVLLKQDAFIDLVMPRGGEGLIRRVIKLSRIPIIKHYKGICHVYVDEEADLNMAQNICFNAKVQRPGVCNAMESLLVHERVAGRFLPGMLKRFKQVGVEIRADAVTKRIFKDVESATESDYRTEYLDLILSVKVVKDLKQAIWHINHFGSHHSDAIVTDDAATAQKFLKEVDSACVYVNASTRFTDGYQFGLGAEIGISTDKLHARGPVALEELTTYKYVVYGKGQIRT
ncbi:MAG: gamma-glutamyl phosphate reductase [Omnitrophica WOR_2 bacterium SM23_72]|nr:MAG: gamma-glutamyl phosphate reductase [Omnitrophica WOR_2 bacterium SM23_72]